MSRLLCSLRQLLNVFFCHLRWRLCVVGGVHASECPQQQKLGASTSLIALELQVGSSLSDDFFIFFSLLKKKLCCFTINELEL